MDRSLAEDLGFSIERLQALDEFLIGRYLDTGRLPCVQLLVRRHGQVAYHFNGGLRDLERGAPCGPDTVFRIWSMTKPLTSCAFMILVEEGRVALDDPVSRYIPEWAALEVRDELGDGACASCPMLILDLLRHTSGLTYGLHRRTPTDARYRDLGIGEPWGALDLSGTVRALAELPLEFAPGRAWNYSVSTDVLGHLIEVISGVPFEQFLQDRVLGPLGMADTGFILTPGQAARLAACYEVGEDGRLQLQDDPLSTRWARPPVLVSGGGGLVSTAADYMKFCQMVLDGGRAPGGRLLEAATLKLMTCNHLPEGRDLPQLSRSLYTEGSFSGVGFGLGFAVVRQPDDLAPARDGDLFWGGIAGTAFWVNPDQDLAIVLMTQVLPSSAFTIRREVRQLVSAALTDPAA